MQLNKIKFIIMLFPLLLTGCSLNTSIDALLTPPKLSAQQEQIYSALKNYTGPNISLKYPRSGENLSAFIVDDIDNDSQEEAIVFYKKNAIKTEDNSLRINILDQEDSVWRSVYDRAADGNEVEQVMITKLGEHDRVNIVVGYSLINQSEKVVSIYDYSDGNLNTTFENNYYSLFDAVDLNGDGKKEFFTVLNQSASRRASAAVYYLAVYLDAETSSGTIVTEILSVDSENNLSVVFSPDLEKEETMRPSAYESTDIDGDGFVEIPVPVSCPGYDESEDDRIFLTKWYELKNEKLERKYLSYMK